MHPPPHQQPPRYDRLPLAVQHALRLRGALVPCGPGMRGVGWPDTPRVRLAAIAETIEDGSVAALLTAAWVWGATEHPGLPLSVSGNPTRAYLRHARRYYLRFDEEEVTSFGGLRVTTPIRTILDLLHMSEAFETSERDACTALLSLAELEVHELSQLLENKRRPYARIARRRFFSLAHEHDAALP